MDTTESVPVTAAGSSAGRALALVCKVIRALLESPLGVWLPLLVLLPLLFALT
jgi:hypothetical protein